MAFERGSLTKGLDSPKYGHACGERLNRASLITDRRADAGQFDPRPSFASFADTSSAEATCAGPRTRSWPGVGGRFESAPLRGPRGDRDMARSRSAIQLSVGPQ